MIDINMTTNVPPACVYVVSQRYSIPQAVLYAIMKVEGGQVGKGHKNANGTRDWGPMQINDRWIKLIHRRYHYVTKKSIINDPCTNVDIGAWILYNLWNKDKSLWVAVGHYHSYNIAEGNRYRIKVYAWYKKILRYRHGYRTHNRIYNSKKRRVNHTKHVYLADE